MGLGDWIIASGEVKEANEKTGKKVKLGDGKRMFLEPQVFANNPRMASKEESDVVWVKNYIGSRPYAKGMNGHKMVFNDEFKPKPGEIFFSDTEKEWMQDFDKDYIVVEPNVKLTYPHAINKAWNKWEELLETNLPWVQLGDNVKQYTNFQHTPTFRHALAVLNKAKLFVGTDGGLHHAAAALGIPAVVIWTGFTSPKHLGYDGHTNIHDGSEPCGTYNTVCHHCLLKANAISVDRVLDAVNTEWHRAKR